MSELDSEGEEGEEENNMAVGGMPTPSTGFQVKQFKKPDGSSMFVTFINGEPATTIPEGAQEVNIATQAQQNQASLTPTEKAVNNKTNIDTLFSTAEEDNKRLDKMLFDKIAEKVIERQNQKTINENIEFDSNAFKPTDTELFSFSDDADYRLTEGLEDSLLSSSMDQAASSVPVGIDTMPDVSTTMPDISAIGPELAMAKGGLVARRKK